MKTPKSGKERSVPMVEAVAVELARLGQRAEFTADDDLVFAAWDGDVRDHMDVRARFYAALRAAGLGRLRDVPSAERFRFHDLRHTFGTLAIKTADLREVQEWMGHAHVGTTMIYLHYAPKRDAAARLGQAFAVTEPESVEAVTSK
jgi:integrase